jgi:predicted nucleotidyltransferase
MQELKKFLLDLNKEIKIEKIILFGSRATENFGKDSDVDLIIVSSDFEGMNFFERGAKMYDFWELDLPVDFLCYTPKEFNKLRKGITIVSEALKNGIMIN